MEKQKKIALINDLTGFGRCSTAVMADRVGAEDSGGGSSDRNSLSTHAVSDVLL